MQLLYPGSAAGLSRQFVLSSALASSWGQHQLVLQQHRHHCSSKKKLQLPQFRPRSSANDSQPQTAVDTVLSINIPTAEARSCLRFQALPSGSGQAIVVSAVAEGSSAEQAGVRRGMKLTGISDPIRRDQVWDLQDRPSLRYIRDVLRMRSSDSITLRFESLAELLQALDASDGLLCLTSSSSSSDASSDASSRTPISNSTPASSIGSLSSLASMSDSDSSTVAEKLQQQYEQAQQTSNALTAVEQRQQRRKSYMEQVGQRNDRGLVLILLGAFLLPAVVILVAAYSTGYLDSLYNNSLYTMR